MQFGLNNKDMQSLWRRSDHPLSVLILGILKSGGDPPPFHKMCVCVWGGGGGGG